MGLQLEDGKGRGYAASVSQSNRLNVSSKSNPRIYYISRDDGRAFNLISTDSDVDPGDYIWYLKNTSSTRNIYLSTIDFHSQNAALWKLWEVTGSAGGTSITASNLNLTSGFVGEVAGFGNGAVTGLSTVKQLATHRTIAGEGADMNFEGSLILGPNDAIAIEYDTGTTGTAEIDCLFHFEDVERAN